MNPFSADISLWRFPASLILGAAFAAALWAADRYYARTRAYRLLSGPYGAVVLLVLTTAAVAAEGIWAAGIYYTWPFIGLLILFAASLGLVTLRGVRRRRGAGFVLNHAGLFLIVWGALFGAPDVTRARMLVRTGEEATLAYTSAGEAVPLPFAVRLDRFTLERYDDGTPRRFRSELRFDDRPASVEVNHPVRYGGYTFFQDSYDTRHGAYTVLLLVRDPWLWVVWVGVALLAAGSLLLLFGRR